MKGIGPGLIVLLVILGITAIGVTYVIQTAGGKLLFQQVQHQASETIKNTFEIPTFQEAKSGLENTLSCLNNPEQCLMTPQAEKEEQPPSLYMNPTEAFQIENLQIIPAQGYFDTTNFQLVFTVRNTGMYPLKEMKFNFSIDNLVFQDDKDGEFDGLSNCFDKWNSENIMLPLGSARNFLCNFKVENVGERARYYSLNIEASSIFPAYSRLPIEVIDGDYATYLMSQNLLYLYERPATASLGPISIGISAGPQPLLSSLNQGFVVFSLENDGNGKIKKGIVALAIPPELQTRDVIYAGFSTNPIILDDCSIFKFEDIKNLCNTLKNKGYLIVYDKVNEDNLRNNRGVNIKLDKTLLCNIETADLPYCITVKGKEFCIGTYTKDNEIYAYATYGESQASLVLNGMSLAYSNGLITLKTDPENTYVCAEVYNTQLCAYKEGNKWIYKKENQCARRKTFFVLAFGEFYYGIDDSVSLTVVS